MTPDTAKRYLIHNVYGDADVLCDSKPADVVCVPFGPVAADEAARVELIDAMDCGGPSCLPALFTWVPPAGATPGYWRETRVAELSKPWIWETMP